MRQYLHPEAFIKLLNVVFPPPMEPSQDAKFAPYSVIGMVRIYEPALTLTVKSAAYTGMAEQKKRKNDNRNKSYL